MAAAKSIPDDPPVHYAITVRVRDGKEAEFAELLAGFAQRSLGYPGSTGVHLIQPVPGTDCREFGILRSFASEHHRRAFYESDMYQQYKAQTAHLVEGEPIFRELNGLEAFFQSGGQRPPRRWKMAVVTYMAVVPSLIVWSTILTPYLSECHWVVRILVVNAAIVATLAWGMMPVLTKLFHKWLHRS